MSVCLRDGVRLEVCSMAASSSAAACGSCVLLFPRGTLTVRFSVCGRAHVLHNFITGFLKEGGGPRWVLSRIASKSDVLFLLMSETGII